MMVLSLLTILLFFRDFFWSAGLLDYWVRPYFRGHWFGYSLLPGTPSNSPCQEVGFICPFVVINPTDLGATTVVAAGLMLDNPRRKIPAFLPFGKASRVCVCVYYQCVTMYWHIIPVVLPVWQTNIAHDSCTIMNHQILNSDASGKYRWH